MKGYKTTCPVCGGNNYWYTPNNDMGHCFSPSCKYTEIHGKHAIKKRVRSDSVIEIRDYYKLAAMYYHSSLDTRAISFLHERGFTDSTIQDRQIGYVPPGKSPMYKDPIAKEAGLADAKNSAFLADRVVFPYFKNKDTIIDIRGRAIDQNEEIKYKSPFNDSYYRGAIYPYNYDLRNNARIIITEGEIKADIACQIGFPCLALPGMGSWRHGFIQEDQEIVILFDTQENQREVIAAIRTIAKHIDNPFIATLPLLGKKKIDIDTFILRYGKDIFAGIINTAIPYTTWNTLQLY